MNHQNLCEIQLLLDEILLKKQNLLKAINYGFKKFQKKKTFRYKIQSNSQQYLKQRVFENKENTNSSNILKQKAPLQPHQIIKKNIEKMGLNRESKERVEEIVKTRLDHVIWNTKVKNQIKNFYLLFVNDLNYINKLKEFEIDHEAYVYIRDKINYELQGPQFELQQLMIQAFQQDDRQSILTEEDSLFIDAWNQNETRYSRDVLNSRRNKALSLDFTSSRYQSEEKKTNASYQQSKDHFIIPDNVIPPRFSSPIRSFNINQSVECINIHQQRVNNSQKDSFFCLMFSKQTLITLMKKLLAGLILYYGYEYFGSLEIFSKLSLATSHSEQQQVQHEMAIALLDKAVRVTDSKKLLPALLHNYTQKCFDLQQQVNNNNNGNNSMNYITFIALWKGQAVLRQINQIFSNMLKSLFSTNNSRI